MLPRKRVPNGSVANPMIRLVEPVVTVTNATCDLVPNAVDPVPVAFASRDVVMDSIRRMMAVHHESFRKLAE